MSAMPMQYPNLEQYYVDIKEISNDSYVINEGHICEMLESSARDNNYEPHMYVKTLEQKETKDKFCHLFIFQIVNNPIQEGVCIFKYTGNTM